MRSWTRDQSFHIPPLSRRRPRPVRIPQSSPHPHLVCENQYVHRPIDWPVGKDGCCGRIVVDTLSCARFRSTVRTSFIRIQRKCIPTVRWFGRFLSSGARRRCCVIVTRAAVLVSDAARLQCLPGCPAMHQLACSLWPRASTSASTPARPSPQSSNIRFRLYPVRISVGISFPRCPARCAPSIVNAAAAIFFFEL